MYSSEERIGMIFEQNRQASFKSWIYDDDKNCSAIKMAEAGFYYTGNAEKPDSAKCFFCDKELEGWEADDDPWKEHSSHSGKCAFVKLGKREDEITVSQFMAFKEEMVKKIVNEELQNRVNEYKKKSTEIRKMILSLKK